MEPYSVLSFVVLDLAPNLFLCGALTVFLSLLLKLRFLVLFAMSALLLGYILLSIELPVYLFKPLASMTSDVIHSSEVAPQFVDALVLWQRVSTVSIALGLVFLSAALHPRVDTNSKLRTLAPGFSCLFVGVGIRTVLVASAISSAAENDRLAAVHETLSSKPRADMVHLSGDLRVQPGEDLYVQYEVTYNATSRS